MSVEERRQAIIEATVPLLLRHGASVTTSQIAAAAGIAEGTVFRAFGDKNALLIACLRDALRSEAEVARIGEIDRSLPLAERLAAAVTHVTEYHNRVWSIMQSLRSAGIHPDHADLHEGDAKAAARGGPPKAFIAVAAAIAELFGPEADDLRVAPELAARLLLGLTLTNRMRGEGFGGAISDVPELIDLFLHGTLRTPQGGTNVDR